MGKDSNVAEILKKSGVKTFFLFYSNHLKLWRSLGISHGHMTSVDGAGVVCRFKTRHVITSHKQCSLF